MHFRMAHLYINRHKTFKYYSLGNRFGDPDSQNETIAWIRRFWFELAHIDDTANWTLIEKFFRKFFAWNFQRYIFFYVHRILWNICNCWQNNKHMTWQSLLAFISYKGTKFNFTIAMKFYNYKVYFPQSPPLLRFVIIAIFFNLYKPYAVWI